VRRLKELAGKLPWWLDPWMAYLGACRSLAHADILAEAQAKIIREQDRKIDSLNAEIRKLRLGSGQGMPSTQEPDFVMVGIPRPGMGVRVIASRKLSGTKFDMTTHPSRPGGSEPVWTIRALMERALFVDKPSYPEAVAHVGTVWANWDRAEGGGQWAARPHGVPQPEDLAGHEIHVSIDLSGNPPKSLRGSPSRGIMQTEPPKAIGAGRVRESEPPGAHDYATDGAGRVWVRDEDGLWWMRPTEDSLWYREDREGSTDDADQGD
jgi:hypothetical protein